MHSTTVRNACWMSRAHNLLRCEHQAYLKVNIVTSRLLIRHLKLRFPEVSPALKRQEAQVITHPSAFTVPTSQTHWEVFLRARAVEGQAYVLAVAQVGAHNEKRVSYGHSVIVDPRGRILAELKREGTGPEIAVADIDLEYRDSQGDAFVKTNVSCVKGKSSVPALTIQGISIQEYIHMI
jgi:Carbon-nitrogen hydrolase